MGQSQSLSNFTRSKPICGKTTFGFIFFQCKYDNVIQCTQDAIQHQYIMERQKHVVAIKKRDKICLKFDEWQPIKRSLEAEYDALNKVRRL